MSRIATRAVVLGIAIAFLYLGSCILDGKPAIQHIHVLNPDFGEVWLTEDFSWDLVFANEQELPVQIKEVISTCSCSVPMLDESGIKIAPNGECRIPIAINLTQHTNNKLRAGLMVTYECGSAVYTRVFEIFGAVKIPLVLNKYRVDLGDLGPESKIPESSYVTVHPSSDVKEVTTTNSSNWLEVDTTFSQGTYRLQLSRVKDIPHVIGEKTANVALVPIAWSGEALPNVNIEVKANFVGDIELTPNALHFGALKVGQVATREFRLISRSKKTIRIESIQLDHEKMSGDWRMMDQSLILEMEYRQLEIGESKATMKLAFRYDSDSQLETLDLIFRSYGVN